MTHATHEIARRREPILGLVGLESTHSAPDAGGDPVWILVMVMVSRPDPHVYLALAKERFGLTPREVTVIQLLAKGLTNKEIAEKLAISEQTANEHLDHIRKKTRTKTRTGILGRVFALDPDIRGEAPSAIFYLQRDGIVDGQYDLASARRPAERNRAAIRGKHQAEKALHRYQSIHRRAGT